jgi:hypothetical protein
MGSKPVEDFDGKDPNAVCDAVREALHALEVYLDAVDLCDSEALDELVVTLRHVHKWLRALGDVAPDWTPDTPNWFPNNLNPDRQAMRARRSPSHHKANLKW